MLPSSQNLVGKAFIKAAFVRERGFVRRHFSQSLAVFMECNL